jgi:hypothetical protein
MILVLFLNTSNSIEIALRNRIGAPARVKCSPSTFTFCPENRFIGPRAKIRQSFYGRIVDAGVFVHALVADSTKPIWGGAIQ